MQPTSAIEAADSSAADAASSRNSSRRTAQPEYRTARRSDPAPAAAATPEESDAVDTIQLAPKAAAKPSLQEKLSTARDLSPADAPEAESDAIPTLTTQQRPVPVRRMSESELDGRQPKISASMDSTPAPKSLPASSAPSSTASSSSGSSSAAGN